MRLQVPLKKEASMFGGRHPVKYGWLDRRNGGTGGMVRGKTSHRLGGGPHKIMLLRSRIGEPVSARNPVITKRPAPAWSSRDFRIEEHANVRCGTSMKI
jgi:hypothetical protein